MSDTEAESGQAAGVDESSTPTEATAGAPATDGDHGQSDATDPSEAFQALGNETRTAVLQAMLERGVGAGESPVPFSELADAVDADSSAGFAYHLRQLTDRYLRKTDEGYTFTYAGLKIARAVVAGTYTESVDPTPVSLPEPCPFCDATALCAHGSDNVLTVGCEACDRTVLTLPFPPEGYRSHDSADLPRAFDRHHRYRLGLLADGVCPECGGVADAHVGRPDDALTEDLPGDVDPAQVAFDCEGCGFGLSCPVTMAVLEHPAVVSFYHDHDVDVRDQPLWNVGSEWAEAVISEDPWCVRVSTELDDEVLSLYVDREGSVVETRRAAA